MKCERCGSTDILRLRATLLERLLRLVTGNKRFFCKHCGWTALRDWDETAPASTVQSKSSALRLVNVSAHAHHVDVDPRR
jgi:hypothetical protein